MNRCICALLTSRICTSLTAQRGAETRKDKLREYCNNATIRMVDGTEMVFVDAASAMEFFAPVENFLAAVFVRDGR